MSGAEYMEKYKRIKKMHERGYITEEECMARLRGLKQDMEYELFLRKNAGNC